MEKKIKLTAKQKQIISLMRNGYVFAMGQSEYNGRTYQLVTKDFDNVYFNATVFSNLLKKDLIFQESRHPYDYILTTLGKTIQL